MAGKKMKRHAQGVSGYISLSILSMMLFLPGVSVGCFRLNFMSGIQPYRGVSSNCFFGLWIAFAQNLIQDDRAKSGYANASNGEITNSDTDVTYHTCPNGKGYRYSD